MGKRHVDRKRLTAALIRVDLGESDAKTEAQRLNLSERQFHKHLAAFRANKGPETDTPTDSSVNDTPPVETPSNDVQEKPSEQLTAALKAAGEAPKDDTKPTQADVAAAVVDKQAFCVSTINNIRLAAGTQTVKWVYSPPLNPTSPEVLALCKLDPFTEMAVRNNSDKLYSPLVNLATNPYVCYVSLALSTLGMFIGISKLAEARGWEPKKKTEKPRSVPTMEQYAAQLRPKPRPEDAPVKLEAPPPTAKGPGAETIFDAPLPAPPEELEEEA